MKHLFKNKKYVLFALLCVISPTFAHAIDKEPKDLSLVFLQTYFGGNPLFGGNEDAFQTVIMPLAMMCTVVALFLLLYNIVTLALRGATNKGQVFHGSEAVYMPLRSLISLALSAPVFGGYTLGHTLLLLGYVLSFSAASGMWAFSSSNDIFIKTLTVRPIQPDSKRLAKQVLLMSMCMRAYELQSQKGIRPITMGWSTGFGESKRIFWGKPATTPEPLNGATNSLVQLVRSDKGRDIVLMAGDPLNRNGLRHNSCGSISIKSFYEAKNKGVGETAAEAIGRGAATGAFAAHVGGAVTEEGSMSRFGAWLAGTGAVFNELFTTIYDAQEQNQWAEQSAYGHALALEELMLNADKISHAIYARAANIEAEENLRTAENYRLSGSNITVEQLGLNIQKQPEPMTREAIIQEIDSLAAKYQNTLRKQIGLSKDGGEKYQKLVEASGQYGWITAGFLYSQAANLNDGINKMAMEMPEATAETTAAETLLNRNFNTRYLSKVNEYLYESQTYRDDGESVAISDKDLSDSEESIVRQNKSKGAFGSIGNWFSDYAAQFVVEHDTNPIMQLQRWGRLSIMGGTILHTFNASDLIKQQNISKDERGAIAVVVQTFLWSLAATMTFMGFILAYLVPLLPTIYWIGIILGVFASLVTNMVMVSFWIATMSLPSRGEGFFGQQSYGLGRLISDLLKPLLAVIAFVGVSSFMSVVGYILNPLYIFMYSVSTVTDGTGFILGILNAFVMPLVYLILVYILFFKSIALMNQIIDGANEFLQLGGNRIGDMAESVGGQFKNIFTQGAQQSGNPVRSVRNDLAELAQLRYRKKQEQGGGGSPFPNIGGTSISGGDEPIGGGGGGGLAPPPASPQEYDDEDVGGGAGVMGTSISGGETLMSNIPMTTENEPETENSGSNLNVGNGGKGRAAPVSISGEKALAPIVTAPPAPVTAAAPLPQQENDGKDDDDDDDEFVDKTHAANGYIGAAPAIAVGNNSTAPVGGGISPMLIPDDEPEIPDIAAAPVLKHAAAPISTTAQKNVSATLTAPVSGGGGVSAAPVIAPQVSVSPVVGGGHGIDYPTSGVPTSAAPFPVQRDLNKPFTPPRPLASYDPVAYPLPNEAGAPPFVVGGYTTTPNPDYERFEAVTQNMDYWQSRAMENKVPMKLGRMVGEHLAAKAYSQAGYGSSGGLDYHALENNGRMINGALETVAINNQYAPNEGVDATLYKMGQDLKQNRSLYSQSENGAAPQWTERDVETLIARNLPDLNWHLSSFSAPNGEKLHSPI